MKEFKLHWFSILLMMAHSIVALNVNPTCKHISSTSPSYNTNANPNPDPIQTPNRRAFLGVSVATFAGIVTGGCGGSLQIPPAGAASSGNSITQTIKVTPISHTFVSSFPKDKAPSIKPLRENDATRFFTNARVVHTFYSGDDAKAAESMKNILDLTVKRKVGEGPGVTPGTVHLLGLGSNLGNVDVNGLSILSGSGSEKELLDVLGKLPAGDVVFLPPAKSGGTVANGKIVQETGASCGLELGGGRGGGVISILLNGPKDPEPVVVSDGGYPTSTILWYDI